jgi:hypothetical protein
LVDTGADRAALVTPSQKKVSQGEKICKRTMLEHEAKLEKYYGPKGEWKRKEHPLELRIRE